MATIKNNLLAPLTIPLLGKETDLQLQAAENFGIEDESWNQAKQHPFVKYYLETGQLQELSAPQASTEKEIGGILISDKDAIDGQPNPVVPARNLPSSTKSNLEVDAKKATKE
jgi:hypothetical protein